jgi:hypothetical protein
MRSKFLTRLALGLPVAALMAAVLAGPVSASNGSCTAQFVSGLASVARPLGTNVVVPEVRDLTLGGPNVGQEVKSLFATADRSACPVTP